MPTVFYAWQFDRDATVCRHLIRKAAKQAMKKLNAHQQIVSAPAFELDQDRQGVTGHPHIASVIRKKIKACDVFLADLTHVADYKTANGTLKKSQNPNVLIELGIAIRAKGFERLILVMNTAFGQPEHLPFDLKSHSFPITYDLLDASDPQQVKAVREKLSDDIAKAVKPMLADIAAKATEGDVVSGSDRATTRTNDFYARFSAGDFHRLKEQNIPFKFLDGSSRPDPREAFLLLSVVPLKAPNAPLDMAAIHQQKPALMSPINAVGGWSWEGYGTRLACYDRPPRDPRTGMERPTSVVEVNDDGCIFAGKRMLIWPQRIDGKDVANLEIFERAMLFQMTGYIRLLRDWLVAGPLAVHVIIDGMADAYISSIDPHGYSGQIRPIRDGTTRAKLVTLTAKIDGNSVSEIATVMRPSLTIIWRDAGYFADPAFDDKGKLREPAP